MWRRMDCNRHFKIVDGGEKAERPAESGGR